MFRRPRRRLSRPGALLVVLAVHGVAGGLLLRLGAWRDRGPPLRERAPLVVTLLDVRPRAPAPPREPPPAAPAATPLRPAPPARAPREPQAITLPAADVAVPAAAAPAPAPAPAPDATVAPATPPPLNLSLPRGASAPWRQRPQVLDDERANTPRATLESRIAAALGGSDRITEERLDDGRIRLRRGSACVVAHPNRAERIDPFNSSVLPKLRGVEPC